MKLKSITLSNFRCFGEVPTTIDLDKLSAFVGGNGTGKTAVLIALSRLFGISQADRALRKSDFFCPHDKRQEDVTVTDLYIEVTFEFPELATGTGLSVVPEFFQQMIVEQPGVSPICRVRLEGKYQRSSLPEGDIEEKIFWLTTASSDVRDEHKRPMLAHQRSRVHVVYVPATRDPSRQLKFAAGASLSRLLSAVKWSEKPQEVLQKASADLRDTIENESGVDFIKGILSQNWRNLHDSDYYSEPRFQLIEQHLHDVLKKVDIVFHPSADGDEHSAERLSDGQKSLLYFALISSVFDIEQKLLGAESDEPILSAFDRDKLLPPALSVFAVEEPENHLSPHYMARVVDLMKKISSLNSSQVVMTSHSPSILRRIEPQSIRYFRLDSAKHSKVCAIDLPHQASEAFKYVKEGVQAFPELYFSKAVVLVEGDSEELLVPQIAKRLGLNLDPSFISVVPLGGKHVNHFWKLLSKLSIPHITLLDLDNARAGGGWGRIKYVLKELLAVGATSESLLQFTSSAGTQLILNGSELGELHERDPKSISEMSEWIAHLEKFNVYFSAPLDLDFLMLAALPDLYKSLAPPNGGPRLPSDQAKLAARVSEACRAVLGENAKVDAYSESEQSLFPWYTYLFYGKGKPSTHFEALAKIELSDLNAIPSTIKKVLTNLDDLVRSARDQE